MQRILDRTVVCRWCVGEKEYAGRPGELIDSTEGRLPMRGRTKQKILHLPALRTKHFAFDRHTIKNFAFGSLRSQIFCISLVEYARVLHHPRC